MIYRAEYVRFADGRYYERRVCYLIAQSLFKVSWVSKHVRELLTPPLPLELQSKYQLGFKRVVNRGHELRPTFQQYNRFPVDKAKAIGPYRTSLR
jgi:hypothetical protein